MPRKARVLFEGGIYHITFRGNDRQSIFTDVQDRKRLLEKLGESQDRYQVRIFLYCLMNNHVHLLVSTPKPNLSRFMATLLTAYSVYFNLRHHRVGHLLQGRYGAQIVSGDDYLLRLSRYVHLNPLRTDYWVDRPIAGKIDFLTKFGWSSYRGYVGLVPPEPWLEIWPLTALVPAVPGQTPAQAYQSFVETGLANSDEEMTALLRRRGAVAIGSERFIEDMNIRARCHGTGPASLRSTIASHSQADVCVAVNEVTGQGEEDLKRRIKASSARAVLAWALHKYAGKSQLEISAILGLKSGSAVSQMIGRIKHNPDTQAWCQQLVERLEVAS